MPIKNYLLLSNKYTNILYLIALWLTWVVKKTNFGFFVEQVYFRIN